MDDFSPDDFSRPLDPADMDGSPGPDAAPANATERIAKVHDIVRECLPVAGTPAEAYLTGRGLDPDQLPFGIVLWHQAARAIAFIAMNELGEVRAVQRVFLNPDGSAKPDPKRPTRKLKRSNGFIRGAAMMLKGDGAEVLLCEGPEDALSLWQATGQSVRCAFGVSQLGEVPLPAGALAVVVADNDAPESPTHTAIEKAVRHLGERGFNLKLCRPPAGLKDVNDVLRDRGVKGVRELIAGAVPIKATAPRGLRAVTIRELLTADIPPREMVLAPIIPEQGLVMVYAARGIGKTFFGLEAAYAVASGGKFLRFVAPKPRRVLYIDGEMAAVVMRERLVAIVAAAERDLPDESYFRLLTPDLLDCDVPDLGTSAGQSKVEPLLDGIELLVLDNLSTLCRTGPENEGESWLPVQEWLLKLRRRGISVVIIHHAAKGGQQRGSSRREDVLDTVLNLRRPKDYEPSDGARFEIHFEKARGLHGDDVAAFEARLEVRDDVPLWTMRTLEDVRLNRAAELINGGMTIREVAEELDLSKTTVGRLRKQAIAEGKLNE